MTRTLWTSILMVAAISNACGGRTMQAISEPIPDVPTNQQRTVDRSEFRWRWPFTLGTGTLGCSNGAVMFRAEGTTYALNDAARARGYTAPDSIRQPAGSGPPTNPLKGVTQDERMRIFADSARCEQNTADASRCKQRLRESRRLSEADLAQVEAEGRERHWPPLSPEPLAMDPIIEAGLKLCSGRGSNENRSLLTVARR
jgi:hypothetical protein